MLSLPQTISKLAFKKKYHCGCLGFCIELIRK
jgi:hypothetical protein